MDVEDLIKLIIDSALKVKSTLGAGFLENVYKNALAVELRENGIACEVEYPIEIRYHDIPVGHYRADILVDNQVIIETKCVEDLILAHEYQLVNYLRATGYETGLLINFAGYPMKIKRKYRTRLNTTTEY